MLNSLVGRTAPFLLLLVAATLMLAPAALADEAPAATEEKEAPAEAEFPWELDWTKATARAKAEGKDLLINFTGSDWCGWCIKLDKEVFSQGDFASTAGKKFVFVFMDFPNAEDLKAKVVDPEMADELKEKYGVQGFPSILLVSADGTPWGKTGYQAGGPEAYMKHLDELRENRAAILALDKSTATVETLKSGIAALEGNKLLEHPGFGWIFDKARALDTDGAHGIRKYADRIDEKNAFKAALPTERGESPDWEKIHSFIKGAKHMDNDGMFVNVSVAVVEKYLLAEGKYDDATALATRIKSMKAIANKRSCHEVPRRAHRQDRHGEASGCRRGSRGRDGRRGRRRRRGREGSRRRKVVVAFRPRAIAARFSRRPPRDAWRTSYVLPRAGARR